MEKAEKQKEKKHFINSLVIPFILSLLMVLTFVFEKGMEFDFSQGGIFPRDVSHIWGIFTFVFIHADWAHLSNNLLSFFILCTTLYYFYSPIATRILLLSYVLSGILLWVIGRPSFHVGASGLIYALAFFLFFSGLFRRYAPLIAISFIVVFIYGSIVWYIFPMEYERSISWEGHLSGAVVGVILAFVFRRQGPQKPVKVWDEEEETDLPYMDFNEEEKEVTEVKRS